MATPFTATPIGPPMRQQGFGATAGLGSFQSTTCAAIEFGFRSY